MSEVETVTPLDVIAAIKASISENDPKGDSAFKVDIGSRRINKNQPTVSYTPFHIKRRNPTTGVWEYVPLNLKFKNINTIGAIPPPNDKKRMGRAQLPFRGDAKWTETVKNKDGTTTTVEQPFGKAIQAIYLALNRICQGLIKEKKLPGVKNLDFKPIVQTHRANPDPTKDPIKLDNPLIRINIPFVAEKTEGAQQPTVKPEEPPKCEIYDLSKPLAKDSPLRADGRLPFESPAVTWATIHSFITPGSAISGVLCMDSFTTSQQGLSLPAKTTLLVVKPSTGYKPVATKVFRADEFSDMEAAEITAPEPEHQEQDLTPGTPLGKKPENTDLDQEFGKMNMEEGVDHVVDDFDFDNQ